MEAYKVARLIAQIADTSSRNEKEVLVAELVASDLGKFVVTQTYNPFITYGVTPARVKPEGRFDIEFRQTLVEPLLKRLASRELSGNAAEREIAEVMAAFDADGAMLLYLILSKDLKCGIAEATINAVAPGLIPVFSVMRANKFEEKRIKSWPQIVEPKLDGYRFTFLCRDGHGGFFTRSGKRAPAADHLVAPMIDTALAALRHSDSKELRFTLSTRPGDLARYARDDLNFMVDGEMMMPGDFNETGALRRKDAKAEGASFHIFDIMSYADFDAVGSVSMSYMARRALVDGFVSHATDEAITKTPRYFANSFEEIYGFYDTFRARGLEGAMVKNPEGFYDKKKSYGWLKMKAEESEDLPIVGVFQGEPDTKYEDILGGVIVRRENGVNVRVGGGFTDDERNQLWLDWEHDAKILGISPQVGPKPGYVLDGAVSADAGFKLLGRLGEILFHEETSDGSLRHPRWKVFRDDKAGEIEREEAA